MKAEGGKWKLSRDGWVLLGGCVTLVVVIAGGLLIRDYRRTQESKAAVERARQLAAEWLQETEADAARQDAEWRQAIEDIADERERIGGLSAEEVEIALGDAKAMMNRFRQLEPGIVIYVTASLSGLGLSREDLIDAAILVQMRRLSSERFGPFDAGPPYCVARRRGADSTVGCFHTNRKKAAAFLEQWRERESIQDEGRRMKDEGREGAKDSRGRGAEP